MVSVIKKAKMLNFNGANLRHTDLERYLPEFQKSEKNNHFFSKKSTFS